ncbi:Type 1 glutamine amidotransferase-like domain-containing protein [Viridibacillus sp. NPDC096237]|uniref:Type 1 glutamine amidotransferase-like domain-containing protein n=1 Tax=Viridibacillus sp. NPDC096237 TaxID=3390721 RepID=UPI003CFF8037
MTSIGDSRTMQIIVLGGGDFSTNVNNPLQEQYILQQALNKKPKICFIATASEDNESCIKDFYKAFSTKNCKPTHITISEMKERYLDSIIEQQDIIYIGDGNVDFMINMWREFNIEEKLKEAYYNGQIIVGAGTSAIYLFEEGVGKDASGGYKISSGLGLVKGVLCPYYNNEASKQALFNYINNGRILSGLAVDDGAVVHFENGELSKCIISKKNSSAYSLSTNDKYMEENVDVILLE